MAAIAHPNMITVYKYETSESEDTNQLWVAEDTHMVFCVRRDGNSGWHGRFRETGRGMATLDFQHHGNVASLKHAILARTLNGWRGFDYDNDTALANLL